MVKSDGSFQPNELKTHLVEVLEESSNSQKNQLNVSANVDNPDSNIKEIEFPDLNEEPVLYSRRWFMLFLFAFYSGSSSFQWIHLNIIGDKVLLFYEPSLSDSPAEQAVAIDWLSMVYMLGYMLFMFPSSWLLDRNGLYVVGVMGTFLNSLGAWIKCAAISPDRFALLMFGQCICAVAQAFILGVPARLAAVWFGPNEVSTATAIGVFGNQIGCALGFLVPPMVVNNPPNCVPSSPSNITSVLSNTTTSSPSFSPSSSFSFSSSAIPCDDLTYLSSRLSMLLYGTATITTTLFICVIIFFKKKPNSPPSRAQMVAQLQLSEGVGRGGKNGERAGIQRYISSLVRLLTYVPFLLLFITYGINVGSYYAIGTLLNPIILHYFPTEQLKAGWVGLTLVLAGVIGSILSGLWLDRTKLFKSTTLVIYCLSCFGMLAFTFVLMLDNINLVFVTSFLMGFFMTGYLPVGFEYAAEITFPESEGTSSGLLNVAAQVFGILFTLISRALPTVFLGNIFITLLLFVGSLATAFIKADLKRQKAHEKVLVTSAELVTVKPV